MNRIDDSAATVDGYHARQRANNAANEAAGAEGALSATRRKVRNVREHLKKALELLDDGADSAIRHEIEAAIAELERMSV